MEAHISESAHTEWEEGPGEISESEAEEDRTGAGRAAAPARCRKPCVAAPPCGPEEGHAPKVVADQTARDRCR